VIGYRDIADTQAMIDTARTHKHAVVIGGGLLGLEAANGLMLRGMHVTVVHIGEWLLERQLDKTSGNAAKRPRSPWPALSLCEQTQALHDAGNGRVGSVQFKNGEIIPPIWW
jgi:nitrite reductase (NADH) large subunit